MGKFTTGFVAGSVIGAIGLSYAFSDRRARKRLARDSRRAVERCEDAIESVTARFN